MYMHIPSLCQSHSLSAHAMSIKCKPSAQLHCMLQQPAQMKQALLVKVHSLVSFLVWHVVWSVHVRACACYSLVHACAYAGPLSH